MGPIRETNSSCVISGRGLLFMTVFESVSSKHETVNMSGKCCDKTKQDRLTCVENPRARYTRILRNFAVPCAYSIRF